MIRLLDALEPQCERAVDELTRLQAARASSSTSQTAPGVKEQDDRPPADPTTASSAADIASSAAGHSPDADINRPAPAANITAAAGGKPFYSNGVYTLQPVVQPIVQPVASWTRSIT